MCRAPLNVPWGRAVAEDGTFKSPEELKKLYADAGIDGKKPIIVYCRIGERSSHTWFVLSKILGYDVRNYDGSWTEYGNSVGVPVINVGRHGLGRQVTPEGNAGAHRSAFARRIADAGLAARRLFRCRRGNPRSSPR